MGISPYLAGIRAKIGNDMLFTPGAVMVVINEQGQVLGMQSSDDQGWYLIGGAVDPGEEPADAAAREVFEEAGLIVTVDRLVSVNTEPKIIYPNGDQMIYVAFCFACTPIGGDLRALDGEALQVRFFPPEELLPLLTVNDKFHLEQALKNDPRAYYFYEEKPPYPPHHD